MFCVVEAGTLPTRFRGGLWTGAKSVQGYGAPNKRRERKRSVDATVMAITLLLAIQIIGDLIRRQR